MGFWTLFEAASMPILQVLIITLLGALMATEYLNLLPAHARKFLNKIVFTVFTPSLVFASLAKTVTLEDIISWWFMPVNIGFTFLIGGILGWIVVKTLRPKPYLEGLVIATCSSGNLGNILLIIVPAICNEDGSIFGDRNTCSSMGLSYSTFSMALGGFYIWTYTYYLIRTSATKFKAFEATEKAPKAPNKDLEATQETCLLTGEDQENAAIVVASTNSIEDAESHAIVSQESQGFLRQILEVLTAPPTLAAIAGFIFGTTTFLKNLIVGEHAPLRVFQDSVKLLGDGTIPCLTLILGGNLTQGLSSSRIKPWIIVAVVCVRYVILPGIGIWVVKAAGHLGFLPSDPLYQYVLMIQYTLPPGMNIGTLTQLFDVGQEECSILLLWTYLIAAFALTIWSTIFMWILS